MTRSSELPERISREIEFRLALGNPLTAVQGWASVEAQAAYTRAKELCAGAGETPELFRSLVGLWVYHLNQPDLETASELSWELFNLVAKLGSDEFRLLAEYVACCTCYFSGRYTSVPSHAAQVRVLYIPERHRGPKIFVMDPAMAALHFEVAGFVVPRLSRARVRAGARCPLDGADGGSSVQPVIRFGGGGYSQESSAGNPS